MSRSAMVNQAPPFRHQPKRVRSQVTPTAIPAPTKKEEELVQ
jgi:hypothetical protein